jgi:DNA-binding response OmpR family regulator
VEVLGLTATEFRLLEFMISRQGVVFSRDQLLNAVWGQDRAIAPLGDKSLRMRCAGVRRG